MIEMGRDNIWLKERKRRRRTRKLEASVGNLSEERKRKRRRMPLVGALWPKVRKKEAVIAAVLDMSLRLEFN